MLAELINHMGDDLSVVNAARVSFDKESEWEWKCDQNLVRVPVNSPYATFRVLSKDDAKLIRYLAKHDHWTPFSHTAISLRMSAPVPIRTQCFKHKQGLVENEESRRYISSRPVLFVPEVFRAKPDGSIKQGSAGVHYDSEIWKHIYEKYCNQMIDTYMEMLEDGICPEQARLVLPQGCEVNWIWTGNLYAFANFFLKRTDSHAQKEIQELATLVGDIIQPLFPVSWEALTRSEVSTHG